MLGYTNKIIKYYIITLFMVVAFQKQQKCLVKRQKDIRNGETKTQLASYLSVWAYNE